MNSRVQSLVALLLGIYFFSLPWVASAESFPSRPVRIIVPGAAGGVMDINVRRISDRLSQLLGQPVIVDNRPGANGAIAAEAVARAKPDGYTLLFGNSTVLSVNPWLNSKLSYDPARDFAPITLAARGEPILVASPKLPAKTLREFIDYAKARPGTLSYGSPGVGTPQHLAMELLQQLTGVKLLHVPYKNQPQIMTDLIGGQLQVAVEFASVAAPLVQSGTIRGLVIAGFRRKPIMPDVPTADEANLPGFEIYGWNGYLAPAGTPPDVLARLHRDFATAVKGPELSAMALSFGSDVIGSTPEEFAAYIKLETARWGKVVQQAGVRLE